MVRLLLVIVALALVATVQLRAGIAEEAPPRGVTAETAALFDLSGASDDADGEEADEDKDGEEDEEKDASESKESASKDEATSQDEKAPDKEESAKSESSKADSKESTENSDEAKTQADEKPADGKAAEAKTQAKVESKKPVIVKVATKDLKIEVEAEGVFVAEEASEVALRPEVWTAFRVLEAVPHGKRVRKGDMLVKFDADDIDEAIAEKELEQRLGELALMEAEEEFPRLEQSITLNYDQAKRQYDQAKDEYERFENIMREMSEKLAAYYLKSAEQDFDSAKEELDQLVKMYEADELTEETEEIVLRRQKFQVEAAKFFVDYSKINHDYTMNVSIPRREEMLKTAVDLAKIEFERAKMAKSLGMNEKRYELQQLREKRARSVEKHAKLQQDRALMTLKAPSDGIVYYGRQVNGRWIEIGAQEQKLIPFGTVAPNTVLMTIVKDRPLYVETSIGEKDLPTVKAEQEVTVAPAADGDVELQGSVEKVAAVPGSGNKFTVRVSLEEDDLPKWLMPGMTGKAKITTYDVKDAVAIAADLVQTDADDPKQKYVMVRVEGEDKPLRRDVKLGKSKDKLVEVLKGLKKGDEIVKGAKDEAAEQANGDKDEE